jgi:hypothetical protein
LAAARFRRSIGPFLHHRISARRICREALGGRRRVSETQHPQRPRLQRFLWWAARYMIIAAVLMGASKLLEQLNQPVFAALERQQSLALTAVTSIDPLVFYRRYVCALEPSAEKLNRESPRLSLGHGRFFNPHQEVRTDCRYQLPDGTQPAQGAPLPPPGVGHWAEGLSGIVMPFVALLDTGWHMIVQPSIFASIFSIFAFALGVIGAGILMGLAKFTWHPFVGAAIFAIGTIALSCAAAFVLREVIAGGLYVFGDVTRLAGLCCTAPGILRVAYDYVLELIKTGFHSGVEHVIPR